MNTTSKNRIRATAASIAAVVALSGGFLAACGTDEAATATSDVAAQVTTQDKGVSAESVAKQNELYGALHDLWAQHMQWTYDTVFAFFQKPAALQPTLDRLLANQKDIGDAIKPFYGEEAGDQLSALLTDHINGAVPVLTAAKEGDDAALTKALDAWQANAKEIADFLSAANPDNWPTSATEPMLKTHIDQTVAYSVDLLKGDYAKAVADYDAAAAHMSDLASTLAQGLIAAFPDKF